MKLESLLISRDPSLLGVLEPTLEKVSVAFEVCPEREVALGLLAKTKYDAVIIDCDDLPGGISLLADMRGTRSNAKSVAFAVLNGKTTTLEAFQKGANFVLQKPLTPLHASRCFNAALNFMVRERRRYFRYPVEIPVQITLPKGQKLVGTSTNLSEGGMAVRIVAKVPKDAEVELRFTLPASSASLQLKGQIAWMDGGGNFGVRFIGVPQSSQYQLDKWLSDRLQRELPHQLARHST
jgi:DNA-binding response OmpR family regulator